MHNRRQFVAAIIAMAMAPLVCAEEPPATARIFFSKSFPGSSPEYFEIAVMSDGRVEYRETPEEDPLEFTLSAAETEKIFALAAQLDYFARPVASQLKVAFTGDKILRYEGPDAGPHEVKFSFTEDAVARDIQTWFEHAGESERHRIELERAAQFDRLGVNKALLAFQQSYDRSRIIAPGQFLPILRKVAEGKKFLQIARSRAAFLIATIEAEQSGASQ